MAGAARRQASAGLGKVTAGRGAVARLSAVSHRYGKTLALDNVSLAIPAGCMAGLIGPDGVGKSTLLGLVAGARRIQSGRVETLGGDMADARHRGVVCPRIAYMPQGLGGNLYPDLTVSENIVFFARLFAQAPPEREPRIALLLAATGLADFADRIVAKLSGGMKQKLGLCCALTHDPDFLVLDEPTTGVDPLSRRQFWDLIARLRDERPAMSVLVATAYMEEAERFDWLAAMSGARVLAMGPHAEIEAHAHAATLEDAFVSLLPEDQRRGHHRLVVPPLPARDGEPAVAARDLTRRFGDFTAVDRASFRIARGEIYGFVGSNGCGKTTVMKMLIGLLPPSAGQARLFGSLDPGQNHETRRRIGYMSQSFSLYSELSVRQNLVLHARLFQLPPRSIGSRVQELIRSFGLGNYADEIADRLPLGVRQRLSLAVAMIHEPELLILDEPTSGVDPIARDVFWGLLVDLSRNKGVTILISTHFMNEGARCDRVALMHAGRILADDTPAAITQASHAATLEDAFVARLAEAAGPAVRDGAASGEAPRLSPARSDRKHDRRPGGFHWRRLLAYTRVESAGFLRDPIRVTFGLLGTMFLMLILATGITVDVENLRYAALDRDQTPESRSYLETFSGSRYFSARPPLRDEAEMDRRLATGDIVLAIEIPPGFGRDLVRDRNPEIAAWIDGATPFRAETVRGYLEGAHMTYLRDRAVREAGSGPNPLSAQILVRFRYNQGFQSVFAIAPTMIGILLLLIPAILMALGVVREKELGTITNLYVTPVTRLEFLLGKQIPYIAISMVNFLIMVGMAVFLLGVPLKGSFAPLALGALLYVTATTGIGLLISSFARTQIAAVIGTAVLAMLPMVHYSGLLQPVSTLEGLGRIIGEAWPATYFLRISVGTFTKALGFSELAFPLIALAAFCPVLTLLSLVLLRQQAR